MLHLARHKGQTTFILPTCPNRILQIIQADGGSLNDKDLFSLCFVLVGLENNNLALFFLCCEGTGVHFADGPSLFNEG